MIEAYAIGVVAKLEDGVTPALLKIIDTLKTTNALMLNFVESVRLASKASDSFAVNMNRAAAASVKMGESSSGLTRASYILDTMVVSSGAVARNMVAASGGIAVGGGRSGGSNYGSAGSAAGRAAGYASAGVLVGGIVGNARIQDENIKSVATSQIDVRKWASGADDLRTREMAYASKYGWATHGDIMPFGEAILESSRLLRTLSPSEQRTMTDATMPYAALEAKLKGVSLPEAMQAFVGLAHQANAYTTAQATPLFESMLQASLTTHASLGQITRASSYVLPGLHAAGGDPSQVLAVLATMMQAGILNTKSGTWVNNLALNALPNSLGSGLFSNKKQNEALHILGLYKGNEAQFYKDGKFDLLKEISIIAEAAKKLKPLEFTAATRSAFGIQGQRAAALFSQSAVLHNLDTLIELGTQSTAPIDVGNAIKSLSTISAADQTIANAKITVMNATNMLQSTVGSGVNMLQGASEWGTTHPVAGTAAVVGAVFGTVVLGKLALAAVASVSTALIAGLSSAAFITVMATGVAFALAAAGGAAIGMLINNAIEATSGKPLGIRLYDWVHGEYNPAAIPPPPSKSEDNHISVHLDGKKISEHVIKRWFTPHANGSSTFNPSAVRQGFAQ